MADRKHLKQPLALSKSEDMNSEDLEQYPPVKKPRRETSEESDLNTTSTSSDSSIEVIAASDEDDQSANKTRKRVRTDDEESEETTTCKRKRTSDNGEDEDSSSQEELAFSSIKKRRMCKIRGCFLLKITEPTSPYVRRFQEKKDELVKRLYTFFNQTVFQNKLPKHMLITWNKRLTITGGRCYYLFKNKKRFSRIELSEKTCDSVERVRYVLAHEMCHAACWLINGDRVCDHTGLWLTYAASVTKVHPELPRVLKTHSFDVNCPFNYKCANCGRTLGRFRRIPEDKAVCKQCRVPLDRID